MMKLCKLLTVNVDTKFYENTPLHWNCIGWHKRTHTHGCNTMHLHCCGL